MAGRRLDPEAAALWARVAATVRPIGGGVRERMERVGGRSPQNADRAEPVVAYRADAAPAAGRSIPPGAGGASALSQTPSDTLDGGWDRRLRRGAVVPDRSIDLHGHTLAGAHLALERTLADAVAARARVLLVITGKPPRAGAERRGLIRASVADWLAGSPHAAHIAAVRHAHPRHGGAGALYLILRRGRGG